MGSLDTTWISVAATALTVTGTVIVAYINRQNKPMRDVLKRTKFDGDGTLADALGVLQRQLREEQERYDRQIRELQKRHADEIQYYIDQLRMARQAVADLRKEKDIEIAALREKLDDHEKRLNEGHIGEGR